MNRRDMFRLIPFAVPALAAGARSVPGQTVPACPHAGNPSEPLGMMYTRRVREMLQWVRENQSENILEAAYAIARTVEKGGKVWCYWDLGHTNRSDIFPGRPGEPEIVTGGYDPKQVRDGDLVLCNFPMVIENYEDIAKKNLFVVGGACPWSGDVAGQGEVQPAMQQLKIRPHSDIWIETNITNIGAQIKVPGSPVPLGPESGPLSGTIFWMMIADACRVLARDGKPVKVKGDEPPLDAKVPRVSLDAPLMGDYFNQMMMELEMIGMEMGNIRKMAGLAVDSLLAGGSVYFYSRYPESLRGEATGRRGGFAFAKGFSDGAKIECSAKDCVIMGVYQPDDEADLRNLRTFRSMGMKVGSIGPVTRNFQPPEGWAVHKESHVHVGRMTDTYGIFALPGFERKICPTSGMVNIAILWAVSGEIADQIIARTGGNVPGVNLNGALMRSAAHRARINTMMQTRGY
ncbi:MAG: hypothetical protein ACYC9O_15370 [Candidatus Latescibacterota bacterium]